MRLFKWCSHYWEETGIPDDMVFLNSKFVYECVKCGKRKSFRNAPVNWIGE
jgi:hypothetical protein